MDYVVANMPQTMREIITLPTISTSVDLSHYRRMITRRTVCSPWITTLVPLKLDSSWTLLIMQRTFDVEWECYFYFPTRLDESNERMARVILEQLLASRRFQIIDSSVVSTVDDTPDDKTGDGPLVLAVAKCYMTSEGRSEWESDQIRAEALTLV